MSKSRAKAPPYLTFAAQSAAHVASVQGTGRHDIRSTELQLPVILPSRTCHVLYGGRACLPARSEASIYGTKKFHSPTSKLQAFKVGYIRKVWVNIHRLYSLYHLVYQKNLSLDQLTTVQLPNEYPALDGHPYIQSTYTWKSPFNCMGVRSQQYPTNFAIRR
ncbi:hypothetical protein CFIO01_13205 [Colletotrichum fioriniae PJ7]|uniref:Uncharacterized protein n=1 Tax=Colletotrichum fioriniae PJ7 TaxID=1445577 RepID=A0A010RGM1_9PEZI|nr:hypothetical protein CFIO01_13205 [Colletotrichum fioriniae PJ7]